MKVLIKKTWSIRGSDTQADDSTSPQETSFEVSALGQPVVSACLLQIFEHAAENVYIIPEMPYAFRTGPSHWACPSDLKV